jgi:glutathione S-transferase
MMKLYSWDLSPYSARVRMQIYAKGLTDIAIERAPHVLTRRFYEDHPIGRLPMLEIDGEGVPESAVIAEYLEEIYPKPSLLGATARENAHIRSLARIADVYLMNNTFMLSVQTRALSAKTPITTDVEGIVALLGDQLASGTKALDRMIGRDGFACLGRVTLADCALVPALFFLETVVPRTGVPDPIAANTNVSAYWAAIQQEEHAARVLVELHRGLVERRELIRSGALEKIRAESRAVREAAERPQSAWLVSSDELSVLVKRP